MPTPKRQLAAIVFADIVGYTAQMQRDEAAALRMLRHFKESLTSKVAQFNGQIMQYYGDSCLLTFTNCPDAVNCAKSLQESFRSEPYVPVRIGIHLGDILLTDGNIYGDSVNISSRIESMGVPGAVLLSFSVKDQLKNKPEFELSSLGHFDFKNVDDAIEVFALANNGFPVPDRSQLKGKFKETKKKDLVAGLPEEQKAATKKRIPVFVYPLVLVILAGIYLLWTNLGQPAASAAANPLLNKSIAVLPFTDMSPEKDQGYLGDGLSDDIINELSAIKHLKVIGRTSSFQFKGSNIDLNEVGKKLGVENVLEGSVQKYGDKIRIIARLINIQEGTPTWIQKWDRDMKDVFAVQDEIANGIKQKFKLTLELSDATARQINPEAYENYVKGRESLLTNIPGKVMDARDYFLAALQKEPNFPEAISLLSLTYYKLGQLIYPNIEVEKRRKAIDSSMMLAQQAISQNADHPMAHIAKAGVHMYHYEWADAEKEYRKAYAINPGTIENNYLSEFLANMGHAEEAIALAKEALTIDPLDINAMVNYAYVLGISGNYDAAISELQSARKIDSTAMIIYTVLGHCYLGKNQQQEALEAWAKQHEIYGNNQLASIYRHSDFKTAMHAWMQQQKEENAPVFSGEFTNAIIYAYFKEKDSTLNALDLAYQNHAAYLVRLKAWKIFDFLRSDPRYLALYRKIGFEAYDSLERE